MTVTYLTAKGLREQNEDALFCDGKVIQGDNSHPFIACKYMSTSVFGLFAVSDGIGGGENGEIASRTALEVLSSLKITDDFSEMMDMVAVAFDSMNKAVSEAVADLEGGCTASVVYIVDNKFFVMNVGDSPVWHIKKGKADLLSEIHTVGEQKLFAGEITKNIPEDDFHTLTQSLGSGGEYFAPSLITGQLNETDALLICSDGLEDFVKKNRLGKRHRWLNKMLTPNINSLLSDNTTFVLIEV